MMGVLNENLPEGEEERNAAAVAQAEEAAAAATQAHKSQSKTGKFFEILRVLEMSGATVAWTRKKKRKKKTNKNKSKQQKKKAGRGDNS